jgi:hypothetical protein
MPKINIDREKIRMIPAEEEALTGTTPNCR